VARISERRDKATMTIDGVYWESFQAGGQGMLNLGYCASLVLKHLLQATELVAVLNEGEKRPTKRDNLRRLTRIKCQARLG
jgi:hypothetical protein